MWFTYATTSEVETSESETKYKGSSQGNHIRVLRQISVQISTYLFCDTVGGKKDSKYIQVNAEKYIAIWGRSC